MTSSRYPVPAAPFRCEIEVERSRFITSVQPVATTEEAQAFVSALKSEFPDASHNCWAYLVGSPGSSDRIGLSDDGEPHGCAGKPILTCLQYSGLGDVAMVVTRYFGGIKLGKGGMVKAYTAAAKAALDQLPRSEKIEWVHFVACLDYSLLTPFERALKDYEAEVLAADYSDRVSIKLRMPSEREDSFRRMFADLSAGQGQLQAVTE
jgi:uncharacterized YigZ family protein